MNIFTKLTSFFNKKKSEITKTQKNSSSLVIAKDLKDFLENEVLSGLDISKDQFWSSFETIVNQFSPRNKDLLQKRDNIQAQIDAWHIDRKGQDFNLVEYKSFLTDIGYIAPRSNDFTISTENVDPEIKTIAGPQLVVPVMNARFALNAANARWGSLYDALYGTDVISESDGAEKAGGYNAVRGDRVIDFAKNFLDETIPLAEGSYQDVLGFEFVDGNIHAILPNALKTQLKNPAQYIGYRDDNNNAYSLLFKNNNLHFEIQIDPHHAIGQTDKAGIRDILMESAITTIQDCEDSVAAVDGEDKTAVYRNWLGLMKGDLKESFTKNNSVMTRRLNPDRNYISKDGHKIILPGRSLMLVRNVGHLMTNPSVLDAKGNEVPEGIIDAMFTICIAMHDLNKNGLYCKTKNAWSRRSSIHM
jgi:malate synthase